MLFVFLMGDAGSTASRAFIKMIQERRIFELGEVLVGLGLFVYLTWVLFDSSWLNFDDEEKEKSWKTSRWTKFLPLFLLPIVKIFSINSGVDIAHWFQSVLVATLGYLSLCMAYGSGVGRLFQPFTVPRSRVYTDEKGQKFEVNFIGTTLSILLVLLPSWISMPAHLGRIYRFITEAKPAIPAAAASLAESSLSATADGRLIADVVVLLFMFYSFGIMFISCVQVTFFLRKGAWNYMRFAPIPLTPIAILFTDQLCTYQTPPYTVSAWLTMLCYVIINFVVYVSLVSPPESLSAVLFQPHVPMIITVSDLPDMKDMTAVEKPRTNAVFPETQTEVK